MRLPRLARSLLLSLTVSLALALAACSSGGSDGSQPVRLRLGYFPNLTHAQPLVGLARGTFQEHLGPDATLETKTFNAGPSAIEALFAGEIDAAYIGPNPAINGYVRSNGKDLRIVAGAVSGGALLVVRPAAQIQRPADLAGKRLASPQLGNTQDVALRAYLQAHGLAAREQGGSVTVVPTANPDILTLFRKGEIDGAWVPEPWATRLVQEAGGQIFLDERELWPGGTFATTLLVVRTRFLEEHPDAVHHLLRAHVETTRFIQDHPDEAKLLINQGIQELTGQALPQAVIDGAWGHLEVTYQPMVASLTKAADDAFALGFLGEKRPDLSGIYALDPLNAVLRDLGLPPAKEE
ncbi:MAG TPA: ABC transporter substrate-binding protein [Dehalococcoidia bacterium]